MNPASRLTDRFRKLLLAREKKAGRAILGAYLKAYDTVSKAASRWHEKLAAKAAATGLTLAGVAKQHPSWPFEQRRLENFAEEIRAAIAQANRMSAVEVSMSQLDGFRFALDHADRLIIAALPQGARDILAISFTKPNPAAFEAMVGQLADGTPLSELFAEYGTDAAAKMKQTMLRSFLLGQGPRDTARLLRVDMAGNAARALRVARTETLRAYRTASHQAFIDNPAVTGWEWSAEPDACAYCTGLDGSLHTLDESIDDMTHPNCFPAGVLVSGPAAFAATERRYNGEMVKIGTRTGRLLTVTPNHPILTTEGWVGAGLLNEGADVVCGSDLQGLAVLDGPDDYQVPALIEQVMAALRGSLGMTLHTMPTASVDFHGDGGDGQVDVVAPDRLLWPGLQVREPSREPKLCLGHTMLALFASTSALLQAPLGVPVPTSRGLHEGGQVSVLRRGPLRGHKPVGFGLPSARDAVLQQDALDRTTTYPVPTRESVLRFACEVTTDEVINVRRFPFAGHVFNLQTREGWYLAEGIVTHNCRCAEIPLTASYADLAAQFGLAV